MELQRWKLQINREKYERLPDVRGSRSLFNYLVPMYKGNKLKEEGGGREGKMLLHRPKKGGVVTGGTEVKKHRHRRCAP